MHIERKLSPFVSFCADIQEARKSMGLSQKAFAEAIGISTRRLEKIENGGALPSLTILNKLIQLLARLMNERRFL